MRMTGTQGTDRDLDSAANRDIARDLAEESIILLSNAGSCRWRQGPRSP